MHTCMPFAVGTDTASGQRIFKLHQVKGHRRGGVDHSTGAKVLPDSVCFVAGTGVASVGVASEGDVDFLEGHSCEISPSCRMLR